MANTAASWLDSPEETSAPSSTAGGDGEAPWQNNPAKDTTSKAQEKDGEKVMTPEQRYARYGFGFLTIGMCVFVAATGAMAVKFSTSENRVLSVDGSSMCTPMIPATNPPTASAECATPANDTGNVFVGLYMVAFAFILFVFEVGRLTGATAINTLMKKNFGFLTGVHGKSLYIIFMAILIFGLTQPIDLATACGITVGLYGPILTIYNMKFPEHFEKIKKYDPVSDQ